MLFTRDGATFQDQLLAALNSGFESARSLREGTDEGRRVEFFLKNMLYCAFQCAQGYSIFWHDPTQCVFDVILLNEGEYEIPDGADTSTIDRLEPECLRKTARAVFNRLTEELSAPFSVGIYRWPSMPANAPAGESVGQPTDAGAEEVAESDVRAKWAILVFYPMPEDLRYSPADDAEQVVAKLWG